MRAKATKGKWSGGRRPYGYTIDPATSKLVPHPAEAPHVREMLRLYTRQRLGTRAITHGDDVRVPDAHPALVDQDTFRRAAEIAAARSGSHTQRAASPGDYHLTSLIRCPRCGCKYIGQSATGRSQTYRYYICFTRPRYGPQACGAARIPAGETDHAALQALAAF